MWLLLVWHGPQPEVLLSQPPHCSGNMAPSPPGVAHPPQGLPHSPRDHPTYVFSSPWVSPISPFSPRAPGNFTLYLLGYLLHSQGSTHPLRVSPHLPKAPPLIPGVSLHTHRDTSLIPRAPQHP